MVRYKVKLAFIENNVKRKATYKKRLEGLMKKVSALGTLCDINICAIAHSPYDDPNVRVWPSNLGVRYVISQFKNMSLLEKTKNMLNQETFLRDRIVKINEQVRKQQIENREKKITELMLQCLVERSKVQDLFQPDLNDLDGMIDLKLNQINQRMEALKGSASAQQVSHPLLPQSPVMAMQQIGSSPPAAQIPQWVFEWINHPSQGMGFGQVQENQIHHGRGK